MRVANRSTCGHSSEADKLRFTQPQASARSAGTSSQPSTTSSARPRPSRRDSRTVPEPPGRMPSATSGWLNTARPLSAKRMSQLSAISLPPPPARPSITAMVVLGMVRSASHMRWKGDSGAGGASGSKGAAGNFKIRPTSKCAMKKSGLADASTTTRTSSSAAS